jgi:hypothetical protein
VKRLLNDLPPAWRFEEREQIRHADVRAGQVAGPAGDLKSNNSYGIEDVHTHDSRFDPGSWTILVNPIEKELGSGSELSPGVTEERRVRMKGGAHKLTFALFAPIDIHLHCFRNSVIFVEIFSICHAETVGADLSGRQQPNLAKVGRGWENPQQSTENKRESQSVWLGVA